MEPTGSAAASVLRFGIFELDEAAGELRRNGSVVRLAPQPFQVLLLLAHNAGEVVDRDRMRREIWGDTAVDFDRSLNVCIAQIRSALNDDADSPRFVQTLPRRGYRFLASIERPVPALPPAAPVEQVRTRLWSGIVVAGILIFALGGLGFYLRSPPHVVRLAVLPFDTVGLADADTPQIDGLFDELLTRMGGVQPDRLQVIGRRSVAVFRGARKPLREIGERLRVDYALETTVRSESGNLRVATRLARIDNEALLWSETFAQATAPGEFEEDVVARVSAAVLTKLFPAAPSPTREQGCQDGWEPYRTGRLLANRGSAADLEKSLGFFEQVRCAAARTAEAEVLVRMAKMGSKRPNLWDRARTSAQQALQLDVNAEGAHLSLANVAFWKDWDWKTAEREFQAALRRNPSDPDAHHDYAWLLIALGRKSEGVASLERALALDPLSARVNMDAGWLLLQAGRFRQAAAQARRALELNPEMAEARACAARALLYAGDDRAALDALGPLLTNDERQSIAGLRPPQAMRKLFASGIKAKGAMDPYQRAWRLAWVGAKHEALDELEEAFRRRSSMMPLVASDPAFESIRKEPRFRTVVRSMGL